jgi:catechol 2,3-dioxygenase-like lactoylglutathione lyase family enzyme
MEKPKIRHLALFARNPEKVAKFYERVFEMEIVHKTPTSGAYFVSDGYITLAVLPHKLKGSSPVGLNHFGFHVDDIEKFAQRISAEGLEAPDKRPDDRPYAEQRACDPEGNMFDLSIHGYDRVQTGAERDEKTGQKVLA